MLETTPEYQAILSELAWLSRNVRLDPEEFAETHLKPLAQKLNELANAVAEGVI